MARILLGETRRHIIKHWNELYVAISEATIEQCIQVLKASVSTVKLHTLISFNKQPVGCISLSTASFPLGVTHSSLSLEEKKKKKLPDSMFHHHLQTFSIFKELSNRLVFT